MSHTYSEIKNQPVSWRQTISATLTFWDKVHESIGITDDTQFIFTGCGTSFYLAQSAASSFQEITGHMSRPVPASEIFLSPSSVLNNTTPTIVFAISRSGKTSEIILATEYLQANYHNVSVIGVTCRSSEKLSKVTPTCITLDHADEKSVVMTQSFTNMLLALQIVALKIARKEDQLAQIHQLPDILSSSFDTLEGFASRNGSSLDYNYYVFLGLGKYFGLANEANLKLKEMTQTTCEAYNPLEFRHGPFSMLTPHSCAIVLVGHEGDDYVMSVARDITSSGASVIGIVPGSDHGTEGFSDVVTIAATLDDWSRSILYMPTLQLLAYFKATALGLNPDRPRNLTQVVVI